MIKKFESLRTEAYRCPAGVWTIGWGHTEGVRPGQTITEAEAEALLRADVEAIEARLDALTREAGVTLTDNRRTALVSFIFNVGFSAFSRSTLWRKIKADPDDPAIAAEFARWKYAGGKIMPGLVRRRSQEAALYFSR